MRRISHSVWTACLTACLVAGCGQKSNIADGSRDRMANRSTQPAVGTIADLRRLLPTGMGTNELLASFGEPGRREPLGRGVEEWHYSLSPFPADDEMRGTYVVGVGIGITNGHLAYLSCTYAEVPRQPPKQIVPLDGNSRSNTAPLELFVVSSTPVAGGRFIDTERLPKLGFIPPTPSLVITQLKDLTLEERTSSNSENQVRSFWSFGVFLTEEDTARLKSVTAANVSKKLLVMVGNEPVTAPTITSPLETGSFAIDCAERPLMEAVQKQLAAMHRQAPKESGSQ
jgi:hypothetical protein